VDEVADRRAGEASGGQVQRAAVARALAHEPVLVLADEPTGSLDTLAGEQVLEALLEHAAAAGAALLVVTHEARVAAYADRDVVLRDGRLRGGSVGATA
jgi:putative ABC transport system ATP-binding protein